MFGATESGKSGNQPILVQTEKLTVKERTMKDIGPEEEETQTDVFAVLYRDAAGPSIYKRMKTK